MATFIARTIRAVRVIAKDERVPRPLRSVAAIGLLPIPGPVDEAVLLLVAPVFLIFYREPMSDAWRRAKEASTLRDTARTMSHENMMHAARRLAEGVNSKNLAVIQAVSDPEIEFTSRFTAIEGRTYRGHAGWANYLADAEAAWEDFRIIVEHFIPAGPETLIAGQRVEALARGSGVHIDERNFSVQEFRDGKVLRMRTYTSRREALEAAGMSE